MCRHIDVQADWRRSKTYGRALNAIDKAPTRDHLYGDSDTPPQLVDFYDDIRHEINATASDSIHRVGKIYAIPEEKTYCSAKTSHSVKKER